MNINKELLEFIEKSTCAYFTVKNISDRLMSEGYTELYERDEWKIEKGGRYFVTRNKSSIIAFSVPQGDFGGFMLTASHSDFPMFKIKPMPEIKGEYGVKLNVEKYGGMNCATWFDRPLSVSGRLVVEADEQIKTILVDMERPMLLIPSVAMHIKKDMGEINPQKDMLPLFSLNQEADILAAAAKKAGVEKSSILGADLFLYNCEAGKIWGENEEFISAPGIDDLQCVYATLMGFLGSCNDNKAMVYCVFDNEEVGSATKQGAASDFLYDTLFRISCSLNLCNERFMQLQAASMMLSADNGHGIHPNYPELSDPVCRPKLNGGIVIKHNANQKYTTDAISAGIFRKICVKAGVPVQEYTNRSDILGGSTLGNISTGKYSINTVDIGLSQLAMHSAYETAGAKDTEYMINAVKEFYSADLRPSGDGNYSF